MFPRFWSSCHNGRHGRISSSNDEAHDDPYADDVWIFTAVVVAAMIVVVLAGRRGTSGTEPTIRVIDVGTDGLLVSGEPAFVVRWDDVWEITAMTRRAVRGTWFGFQVRADGHGLLSIDGSDGLGQRFLAEVYRFPGFDHDGLGEALSTRQPRFVCFTR